MNIPSRRIMGISLLSSINANDGIFPKKYILHFFLSILLFCAVQFPSFSQCPDISLSKSNYKITVDDFNDLLNDITITGITNVYVNAPALCDWDLYARATVFSNTDYTLQGAFALTDIDIRAVNACQTADHNYGVPPCEATRICNTFNNPLSLATDNYIIGTAGVNGALAKLPAPCLATTINGTGNSSANPTTHQFRIDLRLDLSVIPIMQPGLYTVEITFYGAPDGGVPSDSEPFTLEIEIQPILQLKMTTANQIDFTFTDIKEYKGGIVKYDATILEVNSSLNWDLMAIGTSTNGTFWDNSVEYSTSAVANDQIPLRVLELYQSPANPAGALVGEDYSQVLVSPSSGNNDIEVAVSPYGAGNFILPSTGGKTIAGDWLSTAAGDSWTPGSYNAIDAGWNRARFRYRITYKLTPALPVTFPNAALPSPGGRVLPYTLPGYYTMQVKYILSEDQ